MHTISTLFFLSLLLAAGSTHAQSVTDTIPISDTVTEKKPRTDHAIKVLYGTASFYSNKFEGRKTANGEIFSQKKLTAACNVLPLGTRIRVTNLSNGKSVIVKTNDRLHPHMKRLLDLTKAAAIKLGYVGKGLTRIKLEVIELPFKKKKVNKSGKRH